MAQAHKISPLEAFDLAHRLHRPHARPADRGALPRTAPGLPPDQYRRRQPNPGRHPPRPALSLGDAARLFAYYQAGFDAGADAVLNTSSSVGEVVDLARPLFDLPILKIDRPMAEMAVRTAKSIGVLATLPTTLAPTVRLIRSEAEKAGKEVQIVEGLAAGAFEALMAGHAERHDILLRETAQRTAEKVDLIVLAQGSMAHMERPLADLTGRTVLSSPRLGVLAVKKLLEAKGGEDHHH